jgi:YHS domain-containing protein
MKSRSFAAVVTVSLLLLGASLHAADQVKLDGIKCPVANKPAKAGTEVDYKGGKVYFCCQNCPKTFTAHTEKFAAKANHQLAATGQAYEVKCPLTGRPLNAATAIDVGGVKVAFCCNNCKGRAEAAQGDAQITLIFNDKSFGQGYKVGKTE